jgi:2-polyprenyl-3-methyl-5-hydroxy-6-metoxy-1,4-benzoquinol methylase
MKQNKIDNGGERVDIIYDKKLNTGTLDMYQKSHFARYEFAKKHIKKNSVCGDFACGTGYGSVMIAGKAKKVIAVDKDAKVISEIKKRYQEIKNVEFVRSDLLKLKLKRIFDYIISFETLEHFSQKDIIQLLNLYHHILKPSGTVIFSTPYMQEDTVAAKKMGFHKTFFIGEGKINTWLLRTGFKPNSYKYQNYQTHTVLNNPKIKDFIICIAKKI